MATSSVSKGTVFRGPEGQVALRMGPAVTAYQYFVIHPDNGGYPVSTDKQITEIEGAPATEDAEAVPGWTKIYPSGGDSA